MSEDGGIWELWIMQYFSMDSKNITRFLDNYPETFYKVCVCASGALYVF